MGWDGCRGAGGRQGLRGSGHGSRSWGQVGRGWTGMGKGVEGKLQTAWPPMKDEYEVPLEGCPLEGCPLEGCPLLRTPAPVPPHPCISLPPSLPVSVCVCVCVCVCVYVCRVFLTLCVCLSPSFLTHTCATHTSAGDEPGHAGANADSAPQGGGQLSGHSAAQGVPGGGWVGEGCLGREGVRWRVGLTRVLGPHVPH